MKIKNSLSIGLMVFITLATTALVYSNNQGTQINITSQEPLYISEAKKNIVGVWYDEEFPTTIWEFKEDGKLICHSRNNLPINRTYRIVNTTPICGKKVLVDEKQETLYLITKDEDGIENCFEIYLDNENSKATMNLWALGMTADAITVFIKKSKTRVEKF